MADQLVLHVVPLSSPMPGIDPFIFGAYHQDHYPKGNGQLGVSPEVLAGRDIGMDFSGKDGFSLYHGEQVPGFPAHPHRGFETVTIVRKGLVDHADSLGATARYGEGDVQWLTTGAGVQHGEMFPLVHTDKDNTLDLFQLWLNLPAKSKMAPPSFTMFWAETIPSVALTDAHGKLSTVTVIAGDFEPQDAPLVKALTPPPHSWASEPDADVAIWIIQLDPQAQLTLPRASTQAKRALYLTQGTGLVVGEQRFTEKVMLELKTDQLAPIKNHSDTPMELLLLQGKPIGEPVAARGPFVMNNQQELLMAIQDYQRTGFGGWPWPTSDHTHGQAPRFAKYPDGHIEKPPRT